jgi:ferredoxin
MQVHVDRTLCENHGQCVIAAPDVFSMDDDGILVFDPSHVDEHSDEVEDAADVCPAQAILLGKTS